MGPWRIGTHGRVLAVLAAALCAALAAPAAAPAAKAKPCKHGQVRKKGRCVKKPKKAKPAAPKPAVVPNTPAPSSAGPAVLDTVGFNTLLTGTRLYRKEGQRLETWDFCPSGPLHYHGEIPQGDSISVTDWQGEWFYSLNAYSQGDVIEGVVYYNGPDPARTWIVIDFYRINNVALLGTGPGEVAAFLRQPGQAAGCPTES